jgi:GT2 family glycosyltransferase
VSKKHIPIVTATIGSPSLAVLKASLAAYAPDQELMVHKGTKGNFGDDFNDAMAKAFEYADEIIIANDDIVLTPTTLKLLYEDIETLKKDVKKLGLVSATSDNVRPYQKQSYRDERKITSVYKTRVLSPLLCYISRDAFNTAKFPPINWFSDDVICLELEQQGFEHYISRAFVHHAESQSIGNNTAKHLKEAYDWMLQQRPNYAKLWFPN